MAYADAVLEGKAADRERLEELRRGRSVRLWVGCCSGRGDLGWCEVGDALGGLVLDVRDSRSHCRCCWRMEMRGLEKIKGGHHKRYIYKIAADPH